VSTTKIVSLLATCGHKFSVQSIIQSELRVLKTLQYRLMISTPLVYVETLLAVLGECDSLLAISAMPHLVSAMNFLKNFANLLMMSPCHCHLIFLSPVHDHHYHHFHYASLHHSFTPNSKLTFSINPSHHSLPHLFRQISRILWPFPDLIARRFLFYFALFIFFVRFVW